MSGLLIWLVHESMDRGLDDNPVEANDNYRQLHCALPHERILSKEKLLPHCRCVDGAKGSHPEILQR